LLADFVADVAVVGMEFFKFALKSINIGGGELILECGGCDAALELGNTIRKAVSPLRSATAVQNTGNERGGEFWSARELARVLEYTDFRNFITVITKAREACANSGRPIPDHFVDITEMVGIGSGAQREIEDWALSRYACYLVIQNADPSKPLVALGQTYFAVQTRRQELAEDETLKENQKRLLLRQEMTKHNKQLAGCLEAAFSTSMSNSGNRQPVELQRAGVPVGEAEIDLGAGDFFQS